MEIVEVEKICRDPAVTLAAAKGQMSLIERGFSRYGHSWACPAIAAMRDGVCLGVLIVEQDKDDLRANVELAWCDPAEPDVLARLLLRLRLWCKTKGVTEVFFTCHDDNSDMAKAAQALRATPYSRRYKVTL